MTSSERERFAEGQERQAEAIYERRHEFGPEWRRLMWVCLERAHFWREGRIPPTVFPR